MFGGGPIFRGRNEILLLGKALKFGVIFQKYALKLIKKLKIYWENSRKNANFSEFFFNFRVGHKFLIMGKINNGGLGGRSQNEGRK